MSDIFLRFLIFSEGIKLGPSKVQEILDWRSLKSFTYVGSFHGLATFYKRFLRYFSTVVAPNH